MMLIRRSLMVAVSAVALLVAAWAFPQAEPVSRGPSGAPPVAGRKPNIQFAKAGAESEQETNVDALLSKARALESRGRSDLAAQVWKQVLLVRPNQPEALAGLARYALASGQVQAAQQYLNRLRQVNPHAPAIAAIEWQLELEPQQWQRLQEAGRLAASGRKQEAITIYREIFASHPPPAEWAVRFNELLASTPEGQPEAIANLRALIRAHPENQEYKLALGKILVRDQRTRAEGLSLLESIHGSSSLVDEARNAWRATLVWEKNDPAYIGFMRDYLKRYRDRELAAIVSALERTAAAPGGYGALRAGRLREAEAEFTAALRANPRSRTALAGMGYVRMKQGDFAAALDFFRRARAASAHDAALREAVEDARFWKVMKDATGALAADKLDAALAGFQEAVRLRPTSAAALNGLAGTRMKLGETAEAEVLYRRLTKAQPRNTDAWMGLVRAQLQQRQPTDALHTVGLMPRDVRTALDQRLDWLLLLAQVNMAEGQDAAAEQILLDALRRTNGQGPAPADIQLQFADLFLHYGYAQRAARLYEAVTQLQPERIAAWQALISAYLQMEAVRDASEAVRRMPGDAYTRALSTPDFIELLSRVYIAEKQYAVAENILKRFLLSHPETGPLKLRLRLARVLALEGRMDAATSEFRSILDQQPDNTDAWEAYLAALHEHGDDPIAFCELRRVPPEIRPRLEKDPAYLATAAAILDKVGESQDALRMLREVQTDYAVQRQPMPAKLNVELVWILLHAGNHDEELYTILQGLASRQDLNEQIRHSVRDIWSEWSIKSAQAALETGDQARGLMILETAIRTYPGQVHLRSALSGMLLKLKDYRRAFAAYQSWGLQGGEAADYAGAIGAALALDHTHVADTWITEGLRRWPRDPRLLELAGKRAAARGEYTQAEQYWRAALSAASEAPAATAALGPSLNQLGALLAPSAARQNAVGGAPRNKLINLLAPSDSPGSNSGCDPSDAPLSGSDTLLSQSSPPPDTGQARGADTKMPPLPPMVGSASSNGANEVQQLRQEIKSDAPLSGSDTLLSQSSPPPDTGQARGADTRMPPSPPMSGSAPSSGANEVQQLRQEINEEVATVRNANTPFLGSDVTFGARSGEPGFDRLLWQQTELHGSTTIGNSVRIIGTARAVILDSLTPSTGATWRLGTLKPGATFEAPTASGVGGDVQLSTHNFGASIGTTPQGFLITNATGGLRFTPAGGPVTFLAFRKPVLDTLLSYAGMRDPGTGLVWGGVMATGGSVIFNRSSALNGFYGSLGFQDLSGRLVDTNQREDADAGAWWRVANHADAHLTVGYHVFWMHYERNLRGFSLGDGGYFSPQSYFLFNLPVEWAGTYKKNFQYSADVSLGTQFFHENASPVFPLSSPADQAHGPFYPALSSIGANFNLDLRAGYRITPNWLIGGFVTANNTRAYTYSNIGIYVRYLIRPWPLIIEAPKVIIPDWRGNNPLNTRYDW